MGRYDITRRIERLDPERDHQQIVHYLVGWEFPWDYIRALEMALYRTYCVPRTSRVLDQTREFHERPQRRYDDTALLMAEIMEWGYDSDRGREALRRVNRFHRHYEIENKDFLYVLTTFHREPLRWIDAYGWRRLTEREKLASYYFWREVGKRMNIRDIPPTMEAFEAWSVEHERTEFGYDDANRRIAESTRELFANWFPAPVRPLVRLGIRAMLDDAMLTSFGFEPAPRAVQSLVAGSLRLRGRALRLFPARTRKGFITGKKNRTWPDGYQLSELGPPPLLEKREDALHVASSNGCPFSAPRVPSST